VQLDRKFEEPCPFSLETIETMKKAFFLSLVMLMSTGAFAASMHHKTKTHHHTKHHWRKHHKKHPKM
jgi:hypothetical protein